MTLDTTPTSPTFGRLYVTWDDPAPGGGVNVVTSYCDTQPTPSHLRQRRQWTNPTDQRRAPTRAAATSPATRRSARTARSTSPGGTSPAPTRSHRRVRPRRARGACNADGRLGHGSDRRVADVHSGLGVPFACPTLAQPGGRAAPVPSLGVDHASGRIYAGWGDLSTRATTPLHRPGRRAGRHPGHVQELRGQRARLRDADGRPDDAFARARHERHRPRRATTGSPGSPSTRAAGRHTWICIRPGRRDAQEREVLRARRRARRRQHARELRAADGGLVGRDRLLRPGLLRLRQRLRRLHRPRRGRRQHLRRVDAPAARRRRRRLLNVLPASAVPATPTEVPFDDARLRAATATAASSAAAHRRHDHDHADDPDVTTPTVTTPTIPQDRTPPFLRVTYATRADRRGRYTIRLAATGEAAAGTVRLRLARGTKRTLATALLGTGRHPAVRADAASEEQGPATAQAQAPACA